MRVTEDRYMRDLRRIHLAQRMIRHEVRTMTICTWTGFNAERVRNLTKSYEASLSPAGRHRGPPPKKMDVFLRQTLLRSEASCLAGLARLFGIVPRERIVQAARSLPRLALGEKLCHAFEVYRQAVPEARLTMEHFILIILALAEGSEIELDYCGQCSAVLLVEPGLRERRICFACRKLECESAGSATEPEPTPEDGESVPAGGIQQPLF